MRDSKHWVIYLFLWVACLLAFLYALLFPVVDRLQNLEREKTRIHQEVITLRRKVAELRALEKKLQGLEDFARTLSRRLPEEKDIPDLLVTVEDAAFLSGLELLALTPESPQSQEGYTEIPFSGSVRASFHDFLRFLNYLRQSPRLIQVRGFSFQNKDGVFQVDFSLSTYLLGGEKKP
ncbi:type 4a pilus biogenesis protein PilO [Candidatus Caldatribacterium sp.]|uniref:type 4a pilus biogenesis protein PilO n=1 Tax=Candidatus Caldatribacterium sp. TaxID=2282143 RepID=UPI0029996392|nr:type 4a pilus biogenesis protein PilO [Candidatus Caldatribacterium sp.]MDW8080791.1 type 4a pilus biogenesis protein PilO [Candidatus Calescibacterium sp.]